MTSALAEGVCLSGRFRLSHCIGEGGMGVVWAATNTNTLRKVALKMLKPDTAGDRRVRRRFLREARAASAVQHPNVVEILDVVELEDGSPAMVMELLMGESLGHRFRERGKFEVGEIAAILLPALSAVGAAHALGIVHRDLKPDNIFLARGPEASTIVKVLDFGIAKVSALDHEAGQTDMVTGTGTMLGTPYYMSPEQVFADAIIDYRSDIWAFGVILYQCLAGVRPTQGENVGQIMKIIMTNSIAPLETLRPELPPDVTKLVGRMLSSEREARPQSLKEVCEILRKHSDVSVPTFGDPVFVNVVARDPSSGSGEIPQLRSGPPSAALTRPDRTPRAGDDEGAATKIVSPTDTLRTEQGLSVSREPPAARVVWPRYAALGVIAIAAGFAALRMSRRPPPPEPMVVPAVAASTSSPPVTTPHEDPKPVVSAAVTVEPPLDAGVHLAIRRPDPRPRPSTAPTASSAPTTAPGGLVEKPPF